MLVLQCKSPAHTKQRDEILFLKLGVQLSLPSMLRAPLAFLPPPSLFSSPTLGLRAGLLHTIPALYRLVCFPALLNILVLRQDLVEFPRLALDLQAKQVVKTVIELKGY